MALDRFVQNSLTGRRPVLPAAELAPHLARRWMQEQRPQARSSLDAGLQRQVIQILDQQLAHLAGREVQDAAALVLDNATGEVLAYVSRSSARSSSPESDGVIAPRQAGSTLKPFLYGLAFDRRWITAASPLEDAPLTLSNAGGGYAPENYDHAHRGLVSARTALASSLNIPAVRLAQLAGLEPFAALLARAGFNELREDADFYGPALALGSLDVRLEELVNAYRALANGGVWSAARFDSSMSETAAPMDAPNRGRETAPTQRAVGGSSPGRLGASIGDTPNRGRETAPTRRLFSRETAWLLGDILSDREARAATFGLENPLATRFWSAVKTGTSKDMRDNWCVGWSARYTVGVWVGNFSGAPMRDVSGVSGAAVAWAAILGALHNETASFPPKPPKGLLSHRIEGPNEPVRQEWFLPGTEPRGNQWQPARPPANILHPSDGAILALDPDLPPDRQRLIFQAGHAPDNARWHLDGQPLNGADWQLVRGRHQLKLLDRDDGLLDEVQFEVR
jgi:penicillin-binding protein 1C